MSLPAGARSILDAAASLFSRTGFDAVSLSEIASRAGVCKANIFHHFDSKEALYLDVMREACKCHAEFAEQLLLEPLSSTEKLLRLVEFEFHDMFENEARTQLIFREVLNAGSGKGREIAENIFQRNCNAVIALFQEGVDRGEFRSELDPGIAAWMLGASEMMFFQNRNILSHMPGMGNATVPAEYAAKVVKTLLYGLLPDNADGVAVDAAQFQRKPT
ncbi:TetR/AcrR family transcriptional regulator [Nevskia sp.]|uniref:TetR/AcrR family transcriptional regulator n=1 Tax=Nevskia sp. TaxID=1929292 RepID=UPI0025D51F9A|nr:TetR/AcrR family transcriptional regulator [Nevskia sp.]